MNPAAVARDALRDNANEAFARYNKSGKARDRDTEKKLAATFAAIEPADLELGAYDFWAINSSAGKDSQASLDFMVEYADAIGFPRDRIVVLHADLGRAEWKGTRELAEKQADCYGLRFIATKALTKDGRERDLIDQIRDRGMWPSNAARYCTSDQKRGPCRREMTGLARSHADYKARPIRVLSVLGIRAEESPARAKVAPIVPAFVGGKAQAGSSGRKHVVTLFPIYNWTEAEVWARIKASGVPSHPAYELGMPRLSCVFCVLAPKPALMLAGKHNPELLNEYVDLENEIDHTFHKDFRIADVRAKLEAGAKVDTAELAQIGGAWNM